MPTPSDTIGRSQTLPNVPLDTSNLLTTTHCPPEARVSSRPNLGEDHGLLELPTPPQDLPTINANSMPGANLHRQTVPDTSQESIVASDLFTRRSERLSAGIEAHPGSTDVLNGVTAQVDSPIREQYGRTRQENTGLSQSLDSLRLLEATRQQDSETVPEVAITRPRGPSLFQSLNRRRLLTPEHPQETRAVPAESNVPRYVRWPVTPDIPPALLEATRAQLHRSERPNSLTEAQNVEEALSRAYQTLQAQAGPRQQRSPDNNHGRAMDRSTADSMSQRRTVVASYQAGRDAVGGGAIEPQSRLDSRVSDDCADTDGPFRRNERWTGGHISSDIPPSGADVSRANDSDRSALVAAPILTAPSTSTNARKPQSTILPGHGFGRYQPSSLYAGSTFVGTQCSDRQEYNVKVEIKHVDMDDSFLCGHLIIEGLTQDHPKLETYFEAEIIGDKYEFATRHPDWGSSEKQDMLHWNRFAAWKPLYRPYRQSEAQKADTYAKDFSERENIFMRWKEYFLVPDHRVTAISGASFEGFYYICFNQRRASFSGIYYHAKSERRWQQLELKHVTSENRGCMPAVEMA